MSILMEYLREEAEKKKKPVERWLEENAKNADKCAWCTHIGKFTNPSVENVNVDMPSNELQRDGYLYTGTVACVKDIAVSANYLATAKLLTLELEDGRTVYEHFKNDTEQIRQALSGLAVDYGAIRASVLKIKSGTMPTDTDERVRQVYFPVGEQQYHLLSLLPSSSLLMEFTARVRTMDQEAREARDEKSEAYGKTHRRLLNLACVGVGGTKPQNISYLNNKCGGKVFLLPSMPPEIERRDVVRPRHDFFANTLRWRRFSEMIQRLHAHYARKQHKMDAAKRTRAAEERVIDAVLGYAYRLRELPPGWSDAETNELPKAQRIWLDAKYEERRETETGWKQEIADAFARWILFTAYKRVMKDKAIALGDAEFSALRDEILDTL